jgi:hypothetical protein
MGVLLMSEGHAPTDQPQGRKWPWRFALILAGENSVKVTVKFVGKGGRFHSVSKVREQ